MYVTVRYFALAGDAAGTREERLECDDGLSLSALLSQVGTRSPRLAEVIARSRVAVNDEFAEEDRFLGSCDVVSILPPFSGG